MLLAGTGCADDTSITPPSGSPTTTDARVGQAQAAIDDLATALRERDGAGAAATGVGEARPLLEAAATNVATLGLSEVEMRLVDDVAIVEPESAKVFGPDAWRGTVEVRYKIDGWDDAATRVETPVVFVPGDGGQKIATVGGADGRTPLWLTGPVEATKGGRSLVISRAGSGEKYQAMAQRALADVARVLPDWQGNLVVEVPGSEQALDQALDATQEQYANIAAVTTSVDGSLADGAPVHVFLNPRVFDDLGPRGAQVVMSHESTHVATGGTFADMPTWLLEGFADYVALAHAGIPVKTAASQILARVGRNGPPDGLPTAEELSPTAAGLGATYEEAWLATRFIAREFGEDRLVAFYEAVSDGTPVAEAFTTVLGTDQAKFVRRWQADMEALAGGEPG